MSEEVLLLLPPLVAHLDSNYIYRNTTNMYKTMKTTMCSNIFFRFSLQVLCWTQKNVVKFNVQMVSSVDKSLMNETCLLLLWVGMLVTLQTFVFIHLTNMVRPVHVFMVRKRVSKNCSRAELFFQRLVHFDFLPIYYLGFHYK